MPRISIGGRLVADLLVTAGASRVLAMTLHTSQVHGFFSVPVDHLHALRELAGHFRGQDLANTVVVSPDLGNAKNAAAFASRLGLPVAAGAKERFDDEKVSITSIIGDVDGKNVIVLDDEIARGTTTIELLDRLREHGVTSVRIACTHGLFADGSLERIAAVPEVQEIVCTNTVQRPLLALTPPPRPLLALTPPPRPMPGRPRNSPSFRSPQPWPRRSPDPLGRVRQRPVRPALAPVWSRDHVAGKGLVGIASGW